MPRAIVSSGWTIARLLNHFASDDEMCCVSTIFVGDASAIAALHKGWASVAMTGAEAIDGYKREIAREDEVVKAPT